MYILCRYGKIVWISSSKLEAEKYCIDNDICYDYIVCIDEEKDSDMAAQLFLYTKDLIKAPAL